MIGFIMFSMVETGPDITFTTSAASYFAKNPGHQYMEVVKTILWYLQRSKNRGITYNDKDELLIKGYSDSN